MGKKHRSRVGAKYYSDLSADDTNEPMALYIANNEQLHFLAGVKPDDLSQVAIGGDTLVKVQQKTLLHANDLAEVLGVSKSTYYDLLKEKLLEAKYVDALADFASLWEKGLEAFDYNQAQLAQWLQTRNENLGGINPKQLLSSRIGRRELEKSFARIEYSTYG